MRNIRNSIYALKFEDWKKDKIWEYMNGYEFLYVLKRIKQYKICQGKKNMILF